MRLYHVLLVAVVFFANNDAVLAVSESDPTKISSVVSPDGPFMGHPLAVNDNSVHTGRKLRIGKRVDDDANDDSSGKIDTDDDDGASNAMSNTGDSMERGLFPGIKTKLSQLKAAKAAKVAAKEAPKWKQVDDWFEEVLLPIQVKRKLNLGESSFGVALKRKKDYKFYLGFLTKFEGRLDGMAERKVPTKNVWKMLGLDKIPMNKIKMLKESDEMVLYTKYVMKLDAKAIKSGDVPAFTLDDKIDLIFSTSRVEIQAKLLIRARTAVPEDYVRASLGIDKGLTGEALENHVNYGLLQLYSKNRLD